MAHKRPLKTKSDGIPRFDRFIRPEKVRLYATYAQAAAYFSLPYYTMVNFAKQANANLHIRKGVIVDMDLLNEYMENELRSKGE